MYIVINELEKDLLREIINIGLARAADSFAEYARDLVLVDVPDVKIMEPSLLVDFIDNYSNLYLVTRSEIKGDLEGRTYLLFDNDNLERISRVCLRDKDPESPEFESCKREMITEISGIITEALSDQIANLLQLKVESGDSETLFEHRKTSIDHIKRDLPTGQPFMISIKTQFKNLQQAVDLPMVVVFDAPSLFKILNFIRSNNLYDYKVLLK